MAFFCTHLMKDVYETMTLNSLKVGSLTRRHVTSKVSIDI